MKTNEILVGTEPLFEFANDNIDAASINFSTAVDVSGAELSIDVFTAKVRFPPDIAELFSPNDCDGILSSDGKLFATNRTYGDFRLTPYATPVFYLHDGALAGKYYLRNVDRISRDAYKITAMSAIGVIDTQKHYGGLYSGTRFDAVLAEIIGNDIPFSVADDVAAQLVFGWLPIASKRENLHRLMMAYGVTLTKSSAGDIVFAFLVTSNAPEQVPSNRIYYGGSVDYNAPATAVEVTEHAYYAAQTDETVKLFDNTNGTSAVAQFVSFPNAPIHDLAATGTLTIDESGVNYAIVSGIGTLTGQKYTHTTQVIRKDVANPASAEKVITLDPEVCVINPFNSDNVAERLLAYYSSAKTVKAAILYNGEQAGRQIAFTDPYGDSTNGYVESMDVVVSGIAKANCRIVTNYSPPSQGGYSNAVVLTGSGNWTIPSGVTKLRADIIGGGNGGESGADGDYGWSSSERYPRGTGAGGTAGSGGSAGKHLTVTLEDLTPNTQISYSCGSGGTSDSSGSDTTFGAYSSASGSVPQNGVINLFTGEILAVNGADGVNGGSGASTPVRPMVQYNGNAWIAGEKGYAATVPNSGGVDGGYGGGAAVGHDGYNGSNGVVEYDPQTGWIGSAGSGGNGADADDGDDAATYGSGGQGGHGGGGGGRGGDSQVWFLPHGRGGFGGQGGAGGKGGNGCVIIYY